MTRHRGPTHRLIDRFLERHRFEEAVLLLFCGLAVVFVAPFAVGRAITGEWLHAGIDTLAVASAVGIGLHIRRTGRTDLATAALPVLFVGVLIAVVYLFGAPMLFWAYPITTATFFVLRPANAIALNLLAIVAIAPRATGLASWDTIGDFFTTLVASNLLAVAFASSMRRSRSHLRTMAERDALTGVGNRRAMEPALLAALDRRVEHGTPASLLAVDLDHFKRVNDRHGHEAGDRALVEVTRLLEQSIRAGDLVFRYGGEELVVLAAGAPLEPAGGLAEKLRQRVRRAPVAGVGHLSVSIGVAEAQPTDTPQSWFCRADDRLYRAKRDGRNCVRIDTDKETNTDPEDNTLDPAGRALAGHPNAS